MIIDGIIQANINCAGFDKVSKEHIKMMWITFLKIAVPLGLGAFLIYYSYSKFTTQQLEEIATYFKKADYIVISLSIIFGILSHVSRAYRWNFMLEPLGYKPKVLKKRKKS